MTIIASFCGFNIESHYGYEDKYNSMTPDRIQDGVVVSLAYVLTVDGQEEERVTLEDPLEYLHGAENIVPGLEAALDGKQIGDHFSVTLSPDEAYGDYDAEDVETIDRRDIPGADTLKPGMSVELEDEDGYLYDATVREVTANGVVLDFNPPLAGKTLTYDVQVVALREAEEEELEHGHPHGMYDDDEEYDDDEDME